MDGHSRTQELHRKLAPCGLFAEIVEQAAAKGDETAQQNACQQVGIFALRRP